MSTTLLNPDAEHLFNLCSFFSPEPIAAELFLQQRRRPSVEPPGLAEVLAHFAAVPRRSHPAGTGCRWSRSTARAT